MSARLILAGALALGAATARADDGPIIAYPVKDASFEEVAFLAENAIVNRGLVVDSVSHVGDMLNRTAADVGATTQLFKGANVYLFCSATLSREMMEADLRNIGHCPYGVMVFETAAEPGVVHVGYRRYPDGAMQKVQALLDEIAREVAEVE